MYSVPSCGLLYGSACPVDYWQDRVFWVDAIASGEGLFVRRYEDESCGLVLVVWLPLSLVQSEVVPVGWPLCLLLRCSVAECTFVASIFQRGGSVSFPARFMDKVRGKWGGGRGGIIILGGCLVVPSLTTHNRSGREVRERLMGHGRHPLLQ